MVKAMMRIMIATNGIGLAAPQVGRNYRMFVMGNSEKMYACFNPRITSASHGSVMDKEGCLSFPGLWLNLRRHAWIDAEYEDVQGNTQQHRFEGSWHAAISMNWTILEACASRNMRPSWD